MEEAPENGKESSHSAHTNGSHRHAATSGPPVWELNVGLSTCPTKRQYVPKLCTWYQTWTDPSTALNATENWDVICSSECWNFIENSSKGIGTVFLKLNWRPGSQKSCAVRFVY
jgi:hypothetical protein